MDSIGVILEASGQLPDYFQFVRETFHESEVERIVLASQELLKGPTNECNLDFDDAYQYVAATSRKLELVGFDTDFDRTGP